MQKRKKSDLSRHSSSSRRSAAKRQKAAENAHTDAADRSQRRRSKTLQRAAFCYARDQNYSADHALFIVSISVECQHCHARKFQKEHIGMCCANGKVVLPPLPAAPKPLARWSSRRLEGFF